MHHVADAFAAVDAPYQQECQCQSEYRAYGEAANQVEYFLHTAFFCLEKMIFLVCQCSLFVCSFQLQRYEINPNPASFFATLFLLLTFFFYITFQSPIVCRLRVEVYVCFYYGQA